MKKLANISGILIAFVFLGWVMENSEEFKPAKTRMQMRTIPVQMIESAKTGQILKRLGLLHVVPNDFQYYRISSKKEKNPAHMIFKKKRSVGIQLYSVDNKKLIRQDRTPSSAVIPMNEIASGLPILSLVLDENDLYDREIGLLREKNRFKRGRKWERTAYLSYFEKARLLFSTGVGIRLHGEYSRPKHFRLYFREIYGADQFKPGILFDRSSDPIKCLIVRYIAPAPGHRKIPEAFAEPIALELAAQIGCVVPKTKIVKFFINGEYKGIYCLWERIDTDYLQSHYGHKNFILARTKRSPRTDPDPVLLKHGPKKPYYEFRSWAYNLKRPVSMQLVSQRVNLENLCNWIISVMFCETSDVFQGSLILDLSDPQAKWFWINWDMQWSFIPRSQRSQKIKDYFTYLFTVKKDIRTILFKALIEDSAGFRKYFNAHFEEVMQYRLNSQYIDSLLDKYDQLIKSFGVDYSSSIKKIHQFISKRDHLLRKKMQQYFYNTEYNKIVSKRR